MANRAFGQSSDLRYPGQPKPVVFYVDPLGKIHRKEFAAHCGNGVSDLDKNGMLTGYAREKGMVLLQDLYAKDSRPDVRERGFALYTEHDKAGKEGRLPKETRVIRVMQDGTKHTRTFPTPLPEYWLPEEVIARREGRSEHSTKIFEVPAPPSKAKASGAAKND